MANEKHLKILKQGVEVWNKWRKENPEIKPDLGWAEIDFKGLRKADFRNTRFGSTILNNEDLSFMDFSGSDLIGASLNYSNLNKIKLVGADLRSAEIVDSEIAEANLYKANLEKANLAGSNFEGANLKRANLEATDLRYTNLSKTYLCDAKLSNAVLEGADLSGTDLSRADLSGANLYRVNLADANLSNANLQEAYLEGANLKDANLVKANLLETNLLRTDFRNANITGAKLYGTSRDDWKIDSIKCDYIFWDFEGENRIPKERDFGQGEFEELYKQLPTIEYYFENGFMPIDAIVMDQVVKAINERDPELELKLDSFHSRGKPHAVFTITHEEYAQEAIKQIKNDYENRIRIIEAERDALEKCFIRALEEPRTIIKSIEMGDQYNIKGQIGAVGPGAHANDISFTQVWNQLSSEIDITKLSEELSKLRMAMKEEAETLENDTAVGEIAAAETAAKANDGSKVLQHLKKAGKWAFNVAEKIGTTLAAEALKKALRL